MMPLTRLLAFALLASSATALSGCGGFCPAFLFTSFEPAGQLDMTFGSEAELVIRNGGSCDVEASLRFAEGTSYFTVTPDTVQVPARGSATVTVRSVSFDHRNFIDAELSISITTGSFVDVAGGAGTSMRVIARAPVSPQ